MANTYGYTFNPFTGNFDEITLTVDAGSITGGSPNTFAGFDGTGVLETIPGYAFDPATKFGNGFQITQTSDPFPDAGSPTGYTINSIQSDVQPSGTTVNQDPVVFGFFSNLDQGNTNFDLNSFQNMSVQSSFSGNGTVNNVNFISAGFQSGSGTTTGTISNLQLLNLNSNNNAGQTIGNMNGINLNIQTQAGSINTGNIQLYGGGVNLDGPITGGSGISNFNISGNITAAMQYMNGYGLSYNFQSGANLTNSLQSYQAGSHFFSGSTVGGVTSYAANLQVDSGVTVNGGYTGYSDNPNIHSPLINSGVNGFSLGGQFTSTMQYFNGHGVFADFQSGTNVTNGVNTFTDNCNAQSGSTVNFYTGLGIFPNFHTGSTITGQFQGINVNATFDLATTPQISLAQLSANGSGTTPQLTGLQINLGGMNSTNLKQGINVNDGNIQVNATYDTSVLPASPGFVNIHGLGGLYHVAPGFPVTNTLVLANNFGISSEFEDNFGPDGFGGFLGYVNNALLSQLAIATGKTVDTFTSAAIAASVPALAITGGTITNANMLTVAGVINQGGTVSITNLKGINIPAGLFNSFSAANAWGIFVSDDTVDNWFAKDVVIGGTTGLPANSSVALEIQGTTSVFLNARLSTADETALTPQAGMQLYNNDTGFIDYYDGSAWIPLNPGGGAVTNVTASAPLASSGGTTPDISLTGVVDIAHGGTNNGALAVTAGGVVATDGTKLINTGAGTTGYFLQSTGAGTPVWTNIPAATPAYFNANFQGEAASYWQTTSTTYVDFTAIGGSPNFSVLQSAGFTSIGPEGVGRPGIDVTPDTNGTLKIEFNVMMIADAGTPTQVSGIRLFEFGTSTVIDVIGHYSNANVNDNQTQFTLIGYFPVTAGTLYSFILQGKTTSGTTLFIGAEDTDTCLNCRIEYM